MELRVAGVDVRTYMALSIPAMTAVQFYSGVAFSYERMFGFEIRALEHERRS